MNLETMKQNITEVACYLRSTCQTEADREAFDKLFARNWEYFVIRADERSQEIKTFVECCGSEFKIGH